MICEHTEDNMIAEHGRAEGGRVTETGEGGKIRWMRSDFEGQMQD